LGNAHEDFVFDFGQRIVLRCAEVMIWDIREEHLGLLFFAHDIFDVDE